MPAWDKITCEKCGQSVSKSNYNKHLRRHELHPETFDIPKYRVDHDGLNCQYCGKECKNSNSLRNHERLCKLNPERQLLITSENSIIGFNNPGRIAWNKGLTKATDSRVYNQSKAMIGKFSGRVVSDEVRDKISQSLKHAYAEGRLGTRLHRVKHDKNLYGTYKGYHCDSSWELAVVIFYLDSKVSIQRNEDYFTYIFNNEQHKYFPDFIIDGKYVEVKGRITEKDIAKFNAFPKDKELIIISYKEIQPYLDYCKNKYGKFTELYDREYPSYLYKVCGDSVTG